jgi:hypothetical protein
VSELISKLAFSIDELVQSSGLGRTLIYEEINAGRLIVRKAGRRTIVRDEDARAWLASLPTLSEGGK